MQKINNELPRFFYYSGARKSVPSCPIKLVPDFNPSAGVPSYIEGDDDCTTLGQYFIPFFNEKSGPKFEDVTTNGHEARPGHHLQVCMIIIDVISCPNLTNCYILILPSRKFILLETSKNCSSGHNCL